MEQDVSFRTALSNARDVGIDYLVDELMTIARDSGIAPDRARLLCDNIKWMAARRKRAVYGDKVDMTINGQIDLSGTLIEARKRRDSDQQIALESQVTEYTMIPAPSATDIQSAAGDEEPSIFD